MISPLKRFLKPLFKALADPGLGLPHIPYEAELMIAGVKPVVIISPKNVTPDMQRAIDAGKIVKTGEKNLERRYRIYCHTDEIDNARKAAEILETTNMCPSLEQETFLNNFFETRFDQKFLSEFSPARSWDEHADKLESSIFRGEKTREIHQMLDGKRAALAPILFIEGKNDKDLEQAVKEGKIAATDLNAEELIVQVFAQASHIEDGKEVFARYYLSPEEHDYPRLSDKEAGKRIGKLLGYTENDIAWFTGEKYQSPLIEAVMTQTAPLRRWARKEVMLMDGPQ